MTEFLWAVCISTAVAVFATFVLMIFVSWLGRTKSPRYRTIGTATYLFVLASGVSGLWLGVIVDSPVLRVVVAMGRQRPTHGRRAERRGCREVVAVATVMGVVFAGAITVLFGYLALLTWTMWNMSSGSGNHGRMDAVLAAQYLLALSGGIAGIWLTVTHPMS